ncbi:hypothetical protein ElyMa_005790600 [Elysia marginata]|uniref:Uncharacterized protein n=1 Tax=Elysia marginata TaxID=1093978 RepID=A0AAV4FTE6_9GAST|nr:hypothetical protein ElyMa_005790600 [Elysia marginata]
MTQRQQQSKFCSVNQRNVCANHVSFGCSENRRFCSKCLCDELVDMTSTSRLVDALASPVSSPQPPKQKVSRVGLFNPDIMDMARRQDIKRLDFNLRDPYPIDDMRTKVLRDLIIKKDEFVRSTVYRQGDGRTRINLADTQSPLDHSVSIIAEPPSARKLLYKLRLLSHTTFVAPVLFGNLSRPGEKTFLCYSCNGQMGVTFLHDENALTAAHTATFVTRVASPTITHKTFTYTCRAPVSADT